MADELVFTLSIKDNASPQIDAFTRKIKGLGQEAQKEFGAFRENFNKSFGDLGKPIQSVNDFRTAVLGLSGAFAAIGVQKAGQFVADSVKNFAAYEDALASVQRTTGMTKTQVSELGESLRTLALTDLKGQLLADDLVTIAEAAGQMGISAEKDIIAFTKSVAQVSTAADVELSKSALAFGKIATLFRESLGDDAFQKIGNIGSAFDALADKSNASIEGILNYTNRLAGTATTIGLTVDQTAAIGATLEALGVPAERGSRAVSDVFLKLKKDSSSFAEALNLDADKLKTALETKPVEAVNMVIEAMAKMNESNPTQFLNTMEDLLGKGSGVTEVVTKLAGGADMLKENMSAAAKAMEEGTRAGESFGTAASTQAASWQAIKTAVDDLSKSVGQQLQPALNTLGTWLQTASTWWAEAFRAENVNAFFDFMVEAPNKYIIEPFNAMSTTVKELMASTFDGIVEQINGIVEKIKGAAATVSEIKKALTGGGSVESSGFEKRSQQALREVQQASLDLLRTNSDLKTQFFELRDAYNAAYANGGQPTQELIDATSRLKDEMMGAAGATPELKAALDALNVSVLGADDALEGHSLTPALRRYIEAALASGTATAGLTSEMQATMQGVLAADAAYSQLEKDLNQNQRAILEVERSMQALKQASISASDFGKKQIAEELKGLQVKRSELMLQKKTIQEQMDLKREEIDLGKDAVKVFEDQQKAQEEAAKARIKAEEELQKNTERTAELRRKQQEDEMKAANDLYREQQKQAADSIKWINSLDEATKKRVLGEKDAVKILQDQGVELTDLQAQEVRRMQAAYKTEAAYEAQVKALQAQLDPMSALVAAGDKLSSSLGGLSQGVGSLGDLFNIDTSGIQNVIGKIQQIAQLPQTIGGIIESVKGIGGAVSGVLGSLGSVGSAITGALGSIGGALGSIGGAVTGALGSVGGAVSGVLGGLGGLGGALGGLAAAAGPVALAGLAIFGAWKGIGALMKDTKSKGTEAAEAFQKFVAKNISGGAQLEAALKTNFDAMGRAHFDFQTFLQQTGTTMDATFGGISANWQQGSTAMDIFTQAVGRATGDMQKAPQVALQMMASFQDMGLSAQEAGAKMLEIAQAAGMSSAEIEALKAALAGSGEEGAITTTVFDDAAAAAQSLDTQTKTLSGSLSEVTGQLAGTGAEGTLTNNVFQQASGSAQQLGSMTKTLSGDLTTLTGQLTGAGAETLATSNLFGIAGVSAQGLQGDVNALGGETEAAKTNLSELQRILAELPEEKRIQLILEQTGQVPQMAAGGTVGAMGLAVVNERGAEIAKFPNGNMALMTARGATLGAFPVGTQIIPHNRSMALLSQYPSLPRMATGGTVGAMGTVINVTITGNNITKDTDLKALARQVSSEISRNYNARR